MTAILSLCCSPVAAAPRCQGGHFVAQAVAERVPPVLLVVGNKGHLIGLGDCTVKRLRGTRKWPLRAKLVDCPDLPPRVSMRGQWTDGCDGLVLSMRAKRFRRDLTAGPSICGDHFIDASRNETCESFADCGPRQTCGDDCRCTDIGTLPSDDTDCIPGPLEARIGYDRSKTDSDGNGIDDGAEDFDGDGLSNCDELTRGTKLDDPDSDGDGVSDGAEVLAGTDPLKPQLDLLHPGQIVSGQIAPGSVLRYQFALAAPGHVLIRAIDTTGGNVLALCLSTTDAAGVGQGPKKCGDGFANVARSFAAGTYTVAFWELDQTATRTFQLQYLPLAASQETATPTGPDAVVDAELPGPGLARIHDFTLDAARRVFVRIQARGGDAAFEPCFWIVTPDGVRVPDSERCGARADRDIKLDAGSYFVVVTDKENASRGAYRLRVLALAPDFLRDLSTSSQCRTLADLGDLDLYRLVLPNPKPKQIVLTIVPGDHDFVPCLRLWDVQGRLIVGGDACTGPIAQPLPPLPFYATVGADQINGTGFYCVTLR